MRSEKNTIYGRQCELRSAVDGVINSIARELRIDALVVKLNSELIRAFRLKGSWEWACRMMASGAIVRQQSATGVVQYRFDTEGQRRLQWRFGQEAEWENAYWFASDLDCVDWCECEVGHT